MKYFNRILHRPNPEEAISILKTSQTLLDITTKPSTKDEVLKAVKKPKMAGHQEMTASQQKRSTTILVSYWKDFFKIIWSTAKVPSDWGHNMLVSCLRRMNSTLCNKWHVISLLSIPAELLSYFIQACIQCHLDKYLCDKEHGFCPNHSCTNLIFTLSMLKEESYKWHNKLYSVLIDFDKAFGLFALPVTLEASPSLQYS